MLFLDHMEPLNGNLRLSKAPNKYSICFCSFVGFTEIKNEVYRKPYFVDLYRDQQSPKINIEIDYEYVAFDKCPITKLTPLRDISFPIKTQIFTILHNGEIWDNIRGFVDVFGNFCMR